MLNTWEYHISRAESVQFEEITDVLRDRWLNALSVLRAELGEGFLKICTRDHPAAAIIQNGASAGIWAIEGVIKFADTLSAIKDDSDSYKKLQEKLYSGNKCRQEGMPFIEVAALFLAGGCKVSFPEEVKGRKNPDIEVLDDVTSERYFIEVSKLDVNDIVRASKPSYGSFLAAFPVLEIPYSCYQVCNFDAVEISDVLQTIEKQRVKAMAGDGVLVYEDGYIRIAMAPLAMRQHFDDWCLKNDMRPGLHGMPLDFNETKRIAGNKIEKECRQINPGTSGIVVIPCSPMYFT